MKSVKKVVSASILISLIGLPVYAEILDSWRDQRAYHPIPIVFLHGFANGDYTMWRDQRRGHTNVTQKLNNYFYQYYRDPNQPIALKNYTAFPFLEIVTFINHFRMGTQESVDRNSSIDAFQAGDYYVNKKLRAPGDFGWADKLSDAMTKVLETYHTNKVILIAHSMGGLAAREYLTNTKYGLSYKKVPRLTTLGTPHLGSPWATTANNITKMQKVGWFIPLIGWGFSNYTVEIDCLTSFFLAVDLQGDAVKDMTTGSAFLESLNSRNSHAEDIEYDIIWGKFLFFPGDGVVHQNSQRAENLLHPHHQRMVKTDHANEAEVAVGRSGDTCGSLFALIDSTKPEVELTEPADISQVIELKGREMHIKGKVRKEYLPADSIISIIVGNAKYDLHQENFLKPSDLWNENNPNSPVAEFDETFQFPEDGKYYCGVRVVNPAGIGSEGIGFIVQVGTQIMNFYPVETKTIKGFLINEVSVCSAAAEARNNTADWEYFVAGQGGAKCHYEEDILDEDGNVISSETKYKYLAGMARSFLSFDTSALQGKKVTSAKLNMLCGGVYLSSGASPFKIRIYSGKWSQLSNGFEANDPAELVAEKSVGSIVSSSYDTYELDPKVINFEGRTMFRICSEREEYNACPGLTDSCPWCSKLGIGDVFTEAVFWFPLNSYLAVEVESE